MNLLNSPKVVAIGGGTGISTMLRGLKVFTSNLTAIITVADDGGGSGVLREHLGMLPPGDIRNCILALAETEPIMEKLLQYRFKDGMLKGQSFGNLFLAAMNGISNNFEEAIQSMSDVLAVTGRVLPVTHENINLCAELVDGFKIMGESKIGSHNETHPGRIKKVYLDKKQVKPLEKVLKAVREADIIVLGPGSLYTSIIPNLLVDDIAESIKKSKAIKAYVCNIMTQPGETDGYSVFDHISALQEHSLKKIVDFCIVNTQEVPNDLIAKYKNDGSEIVKFDFSLVNKEGINLVCGDFLSIKNSLVRHDPNKLAYVIMKLVEKNLQLEDKCRIDDYCLVKDKLKKVKFDCGQVLFCD